MMSGKERVGDEVLEVEVIFVDDPECVHLIYSARCPEEGDMEAEWMTSQKNEKYKQGKIDLLR